MILKLGLFCILACMVNADQTWYNFKSTWTALVYDGFWDHPRTESEAKAAGWRLISNDCSDGISFPGIRYAPPERENGPDMILIYDVNGFIAGMHSVVLKKFSTDDWQLGSKWYRLDTLFGEEAYLSTAYFVDPALICTGRTQDQFDSEGTGNRLLFQNGPSTSDTIAAPLDLDQADSSDFWYKHFCFLNMGRHYFNMYYDPDQPCTPDNIPVQLVFSGGVLNGFVWQHVSSIPGDRWESVNSFGISNIVDRPPNCLYDLVESPGVTTMHMYLRNYETLCISDKNL